MALDFLHRARTGAERVALFPGAWNPPTLAHLEIARAALEWADEVVWLLPRSFPHKTFEGLDFDARGEILRQLAMTEQAFSVASTDGGLFLDMAAEARETLGPKAELSLICGRDAAERAAAWNYGRPGVFAEFLGDCRLLVAARAGEFELPEEHRSRITRLQLPIDMSAISSSDVRLRMSLGQSWEHLVPPSVAIALRSSF